MPTKVADIENKVIFITGGAQGIGGASAQLCAERGAKVIIADVNVKAGEALASAIQARGQAARFYLLDVRDATAIESAFQQVAETYGGLDVLVCAAGILEGAALQPDQFPIETFDLVMDINLRGMFLCVKCATPLLAASKQGVITLIGSTAGVLGGSSSIAYGASKGAVYGMGLALENHLAKRGIRVNVVCPGGIETDLKLRQMQTMAEVQGQPFDLEEAKQRLGDPIGVAKQVAYLASDDAAYLRRNIFTR